MSAWDYLSGKDIETLAGKWPQVYAFLNHQNLIGELASLKAEKEVVGSFLRPERETWINHRIQQLEWCLNNGPVPGGDDASPK